MTAFYEMIWTLDYWGIADVVLPFLLVFTISFAVLSRVKILGTKQSARRFDAAVSLVFGLSLVIPHVLGRYPPGFSPVDVINRSLPDIAVFLVAIILLVLMIGAFGIQWDLGNNAGGSFWVLVSLGIVTYIFGTNAGWFHGGTFPPYMSWIASPQTQALIVTILVFGAIVWFITRDTEKKKDEPNSFAKFLNDVSKTSKLD